MRLRGGIFANFPLPGTIPHIKLTRSKPVCDAMELALVTVAQLNGDV
jgi:hypothetical protein